MAVTLFLALVAFGILILGSALANIDDDWDDDEDDYDHQGGPLIG